MKPLTCAAALRRLDAFSDRELPLDEEVAVAAHLEWCDSCAAELADIRQLGGALRTMRGQVVLAHDEAASFHRAVVSRAKAEREMSPLARFRGMFDDWHLVYAGLGATAAAVTCLVIVLGLMRFATSERPDSLAAIVNLLATPGSNENPLAVDNRTLMPRVLDTTFSTGGDNEQDVVFTLAAVVTREGRIENLELLHANDHGEGDVKLVEGLLDAVSRARFEPARVAGAPVAVNMVWMFARTTVRAASKRHPIELGTPVGKRRTALTFAQADLL